MTTKSKPKSKPKPKPKDVIIYGKSSCPFCNKAKSLSKKSKKYTLKKYVEVKSFDHFLNIKKSLNTKKKIPNTVPIILINDKYIGGFTDFEKLEKK